MLDLFSDASSGALLPQSQSRNIAAGFPHALVEPGASGAGGGGGAPQTGGGGAGGGRVNRRPAPNKDKDVDKQPCALQVSGGGA